MIHRLTSIILTIFLITACNTSKVIDQYPSQIEAEAGIKAVMKMQEKAWSEGDIDQFMEGYWNSPDLTFIGSRGLTQGWQTTLYNYKKGYPSTNVMGTLQFDILRMMPLSSDKYQVIGKYTLIREADTPTGYFSLIWQYIDGKWVIISDHTSG